MRRGVFFSTHLLQNVLCMYSLRVFGLRSIGSRGAHTNHMVRFGFGFVVHCTLAAKVLLVVIFMGG